MLTIIPPLDQMTLEEKFQLLETVWTSIAERPEDFESPAWHGEVLRERQRQIDAGETDFISLDEAQLEIDRRLAILREAKSADACS